MKPSPTRNAGHRPPVRAAWELDNLTSLGRGCKYTAAFKTIDEHFVCEATSPVSNITGGVVVEACVNGNTAMVVTSRQFGFESQTRHLPWLLNGTSFADKYTQRPLPNSGVAQGTQIAFVAGSNPVQGI